MDPSWYQTPMRAALARIARRDPLSAQIAQLLAMGEFSAHDVVAIVAPTVPAELRVYCAFGAMDKLNCVYRERTPLPTLYFAAPRPVVERDGALIVVDDGRLPVGPGEVRTRQVRFRTLGCYPLTGAIESDADTLEAILVEMLATRTSERQGRVIDHDPSASMERKKQEGLPSFPEGGLHPGSGTTRPTDPTVRRKERK